MWTALLCVPTCIFVSILLQGSRAGCANIPNDVSVKFLQIQADVFHAIQKADADKAVLANRAKESISKVKSAEYRRDLRAIATSAASSNNGNGPIGDGPKVFNVLVSQPVNDWPEWLQTNPTFAGTQTAHGFEVDDKTAAIKFITSHLADLKKAFRAYDEKHRLATGHGGDNGTTQATDDTAGTLISSAIEVGSSGQVSSSVTNTLSTAAAKPKRGKKSKMDDPELRSLARAYTVGQISHNGVVPLDSNNVAARADELGKSAFFADVEDDAKEPSSEDDNDSDGQFTPVAVAA
jgi:hypothetical protein